MKENLSFCYALATMLCIASASFETAEARDGHEKGNQQANQKQADKAQRRQMIGANLEGQRNQQAAQQQAKNAQKQERQRGRQQEQLNQQAAQQQAKNAQQQERQRGRQQDKRDQQAAQQQAKDAQQQERQRDNQQDRREQQAAQERARNAQQRAKDAQQLERQRDNQQDKGERQAAQERARNAQQRAKDAQQLERQRDNQQDRRERQAERLNSPIRTPGFDKSTRRPSYRPPLKVTNVPLQKAFRIPDFMKHANAEQREHARNAERNMRKHLIAVQMRHAPRNHARIRNSQMNRYFNNYPFFANNQQYYVNRQNTHYYPVDQRYYPNWYQPNRNWIFSNGFTLGNIINIGLDWLGFGWKPYYGESPVGFICARDYTPTPWMYESMTNQWRQPGLYTYMSQGPDSEYTGPITVEVIEQVNGPDGSVYNVPYLYNAFYYPEFGRWGYENQQGYFIWLDV